MKYLACALVLLTICGCGKGKKPVDKVVMVKNDDAEMNAAIQKAKETVLPEFVPALQTRKAGQTGFAVKYPVKDGEQLEHMWISGVTYDGQKFTGRVDNDPNLVKNVKLGQSLSVSPEEISDWMYVDKGKLVGGFTLRAMRDKMSAQERATFDKQIPFKIE
jgi:uncharacterized protein YegJ (DUF2314 family)